MSRLFLSRSIEDGNGRAGLWALSPNNPEANSDQAIAPFLACVDHGPPPRPAP
jgi:hypothetical protein